MKKKCVTITHKTPSSKHGGYTVDEIRQLGVFPFVTTEVMGCLVKEEANFLVVAAGTNSQYDLISFLER